MKISGTFVNPAPWGEVDRFLQATFDAGLCGPDARMSFRTWDDRDYTGDLNNHMVEVTIEGTPRSAGE